MSNIYAKDCLGIAVKGSRVIRGLTQFQLAGQLGITTRYLKMIENTGRKPSYKLLIRIILELEIPYEQIFQPTEQHQNDTGANNK